MSGLFEGQWTQQSPANITGDLTIGGDLNIETIDLPVETRT